jgi:hypothetical protein
MVDHFMISLLWTSELCGGPFGVLHCVAASLYVRLRLLVEEGWLSGKSWFTPLVV